MTVSFNIGRAAHATIAAIVQRAEQIAIEQNAAFDTLNATMDLAACHANGCPLDLQRLLDAPQIDFVHDVWGISGNINRKNGRLRNHFLPRTAQAQHANA